VETWYVIAQFTWDGDTLIGYANDLWTDNANYPFPNGKKQFYIRNLRTGGFRRFRLKTANTLEYNFVSEDGIKCKIYQSRPHIKIKEQVTNIWLNIKRNYVDTIRRLVDAIS